MTKELKPQGAAELLRSDLLPEAKDGPLWADGFDGFLAEREQALAEEIAEVTG